MCVTEFISASELLTIPETHQMIDDSNSTQEWFTNRDTFFFEVSSYVCTVYIVFSCFLPHTLFELRYGIKKLRYNRNKQPYIGFRIHSNSLIYFTGDRFDGKLNKCQITTLHPS